MPLWQLALCAPALLSRVRTRRLVIHGQNSNFVFRCNFSSWTFLFERKQNNLAVKCAQKNVNLKFENTWLDCL